MRITQCLIDNIDSIKRYVIITAFMPHLVTIKETPLNSFRFAFVLSALITLSGCASLLNTQNTAPTDAEVKSNSAQEDVTYQDFSVEQDTLYDLLVAEIASQRNQFDITLVNYIHQAQVTRDPAVILRAINAAQIAKDGEAIKELAMLWLEEDENSIAAHQLLGYQYALDKDYTQAMFHTSEILRLGGNTSVEALAINSAQESEEGKQALLTLYKDLFEQYPESWEVQYSIALVQRNLKQCDEAIANLDAVLKVQPRFQQAAIVKANCLNESGKKQEALEYSADAFDDFPDNNAIGRLYASLLIERGQTEDAANVFAQLIEYYPESPSLKLSYALLLLEINKPEEATVVFEQLKNYPAHKNDANYYLGRYSEEQEQLEEALNYFKAVSPGTHYNSSVERQAYILTKLDRQDEAIELLASLRKEQPNNEVRLWLIEYKLLNTFDQRDAALESLDKGIADYPNDEQLVYARAMHYEGDDRLEEMEADLRHLIDQNPNNAIALNALGYTLADRTDRLEEAAQLIGKALVLKPDNPAIMDSMGWVLFRLGKAEEAVQLLGAAYLKYPDGEVAAHLGEALWSLDKKDQARTVWSNSLRQQPDHKVLIETLQRLAPEMLEPNADSEDSTTNSAEDQPEPELETNSES